MFVGGGGQVVTESTNVAAFGRCEEAGAKVGESLGRVFSLCVRVCVVCVRVCVSVYVCVCV